MDVEFSELLGKTLSKVDVEGDEAVIFHTADGDRYRLWHCQDCCESVTIEDICGDMTDLIGHPILIAEEVVGPEGWSTDDTESYTWTFYKLATNKGSVTIRWYGESNGYYSETVDFDKVPRGEWREL